MPELSVLRRHGQNLLQSTAGPPGFFVLKQEGVHTVRDAAEGVVEGLLNHAEQASFAVQEDFSSLKAHLNPARSPSQHSKLIIITPG